MKEQPNPKDFQEALEELEAGESLESAQASLPLETRADFTLAARLRAAAWPQRQAARIHDLRKQLVSLYNQGTVPQSQGGFMMKWFKDWRLPAAIAATAMLLLVVGIVAAATLGVRGLNRHLADDSIGTKMRTYLPAFQTAPSDAVATLQAQLAPDQARLADLHGLVEITSNGGWQVATPGTFVTADTRLRTGNFSSLSLVFKDGSLARLGPNSEISIKKLLADPATGKRSIIITQLSGESSHQVVPLDSKNATYRVNTPASRGQVKGTEFHLRVDPQATNWYVDGGSVEVSAKGQAVQVAGGEMTSVSMDEEPSDPLYFFTGQGKVNSIDPWVIDELTYLTHSGTVIQGNPQEGDLVFFEGHLLPDGSRVADMIVLLQRDPANTFSITGEVQEIGIDLWTINGQDIAITGLTEVEPGIEQYDLVVAKGVILEGGTFEAEEIRRIPEESGTPFEFTGVVQKIDLEQWVVSGITVTLNAGTHVDPDLEVKDSVRVQGTILEGDIWLASSITRYLDETSAFEFFGPIDSMDPWSVNGVGFEVRSWTVIDPDLEVGDIVRVAGQIQPDGTWVATEIRRYDAALLTVLIGRVTSMDPWVVSGFELNVDDDTLYEGDIILGSLVRVEMKLFPDGSHQVIRISLMESFTWEMDCQTLVVTVISVDEDTISVDGYPALPLGEGVKIEGDIKAGSQVQIMVCYDEEMNVTVVYIIALSTPEEQPPVLPPDGEGKKEKVEVCHKPDKNPHVIVIAPEAVPAHLGHGDYLGPCVPAVP